MSPHAITLADSVRLRAYVGRPSPVPPPSYSINDQRRERASLLVRLPASVGELVERGVFVDTSSALRALRLLRRAGLADLATRAKGAYAHCYLRTLAGDDLVREQLGPDALDPHQPGMLGAGCFP